MRDGASGVDGAGVRMGRASGIQCSAAPRKASATCASLLSDVPGSATSARTDESSQAHMVTGTTARVVLPQRRTRPADLAGNRSHWGLLHPGRMRLFHPNLGWEPVNLYVMRRVRWSTPWPKRPLSTGVTARSLGDARPAAPAPPPAPGCHEQSAVDRADRAGRLGELSPVPQTTPPAWQTGWRAPDPILCVSQRSCNPHVIVSKAPRLAGRQRRPPVSATS